MKLADWLKKEDMNIVDFVRKIGAGVSAGYRWRSGKPVQQRYRKKIVAFTNGEVTREDLDNT